MNSIKITILSDDNLCNRTAMHAALETQMDTYDALQSTAHDEVEKAFIAFMGRNPDVSVITVSTLVTRAHEAATKAIRAAGGDDAAVDAALTKLKVTVPAYIKANPEIFCSRKGRGATTVSYVPGETNEDGSKRFRTTAEQWANIHAEPAPKGE